MQQYAFKYLYIKDWKWNNAMASEVTRGHPRVGAVYLSSYASDTGNHRMIYQGNKVIILSNLTVTDEDEDYTCEIVEITKKNIIKLKLAEKELDKIIEWMDRAVPRLPSPPMEQLKIAMTAQSSAEQAAMKEAQEILGNIFITNTNAFDLILEIAERIHDHDMRIVNSNTLSLSLGEHGKGVNCVQALRCIHEYLGTPKQGGDDRDSVIDGIVNLFTEVLRRDLNNLD